MNEDLAKQLKNACGTYQNEFEKIKATLPKIDFTAHNECKNSMCKLIAQYCDFFLPDEYREYDFTIVNIEPVERDMLEIDVACHGGCEWYIETITVPVKYFTDEGTLNQAVEEDKARKQEEQARELRKKQEEQARKLSDPEY